MIAHGQGAGHALNLAQQFSHKIKAVVAIEPTGVPSSASAPLSPHLAIWGDYFEQSSIWTDYRSHAQSYWSWCCLNGSRMDTLDLPALGVFGNSHFPMMDKNAEAILDLVTNWLSEYCSIA